MVLEITHNTDTNTSKVGCNLTHNVLVKIFVIYIECVVIYHGHLFVHYEILNL